jgi:hypothetical protein
VKLKDGYEEEAAIDNYTVKIPKDEARGEAS